MEEQDRFENNVELNETEDNSGKAPAGKVYIFGLITGILLSLCVVGIVSLVRSADAKKEGTTVGSGSSENSPAETVEEDTLTDEETLNKIALIESTIDAYYLDADSLDKDEMEDGLFDGILSSLGDPYSVYYSQDELAELMESTSGTYYGIGAYIGLDETTGYTYISSVMRNTPAERAGLMSGDLIKEIDGVDALGNDTAQSAAKIKGPKGTEVTLTLYRKSGTGYDTVEVVIERDKVEVETVTYEMLDNGIAHIWLLEFDTVTEQQFREYLATAREEGMQGLILDLRDNPGGNVDTVVNIAKEILPAGTVVYTEDRNGNRSTYTNPFENAIDVPMVVLVNGNSASSSEILAGAIKDYGVGTIMGTTTFGKGIVQRIIQFLDGSAVKLTISKYYSPKGINIHGTGIEPDVEVELDYETYRETGEDNQLDAAIAYLQEQL